VPPLYLLLVLGLQPADWLGHPEWPPPFRRLVYDDYDAAARVLRALNATLGGTAGREDEGPWLKDPEYAKLLDSPAAPEPRYFLEYPHTALWLFRLGFILGNRPDDVAVPVAVRDGDFHNLVEHVPRDDAERRLWRHFRRAVQIYAILGTACLLALMLVLTWGYEPGQGAVGELWLLILPATLYFAVQRFDVVPALLTALSLACLGRRWTVAAAVFLGLATMVKVYPVLFVPLFLRYLAADFRTGLTWTASYAATLVGCLLPPLLGSGWEATWAPYHYQLSRGLEYWTVYGYLLPPVLGSSAVWARGFRVGCLLLVLLALCRRRPTTLTSLLRRCTILLCVFVGLQVFYSPQWILWFSPLLVPLARGNRAVRGLTVALDLVTFLSVPVVFDLPAGPLHQVLVGGLVYARATVLILLAAVLGAASSVE
jgi:hypothetical protein